MDDAICRGVDIELFFPESGKGSTARKAKAVCFQCPVIADCAQWAIADPSLAGVLGGFTERERRAIRADRRNR
jgi:WhiB family redox-sensing transcriptional regulator